MEGYELADSLAKAANNSYLTAIVEAHSNGSIQRHLMRVKHKDRVAVFNNRDCRTTFSDYPNSTLRKRKQILKVVNEKYLTFWFSYSAEYLADIIQSLLLDGNLPHRPPPTPSPIMPPKSSPKLDSATVPVTDLFSLNDAVQSFHLNDRFSDFTAISHAMRYPLHRVIVCPQSDILAKACEYNSTRGQELSRGEFATFEFDDETDDELSVSILIYYLYNQDYSPDEVQLRRGDGNVETTPVNELLVHVCVFRLAEKYGVRGLQLLARKSFVASAAHNAKVEYFLEAVREVYSDRFPSHETSMKSAILDIFFAKQDLLDRDDVKQMLDELAGLSRDLLLGFRDRK
ncbi:hypothetical protein ARSEF4850_002517 [Beauveria asiatica]